MNFDPQSEAAIEIAKALYYAKGLHQHQKRKYTGEPYFNHCGAVAELLARYESNINAIQAAFLHDTIEDCGITYQDIFEEFGKETADLVLEVTDVSKPEDGNRKIRKEKDRQHIAKSSYLGASIKLADLIDNSKSIFEHDKNFAKIYIPEKIALLEVLKHGNKDLYELAQSIVSEIQLSLEKS